MPHWLKIKDWEDHQHYKDRNPPWIKLHVELLNKKKFMALADASKGLLVLLWVLASENQGQIDFDLEDLRFRLRNPRLKEAEINLLINKGFLIGASMPLARASTCYSETETEAETEADRVALDPKKLVGMLNAIPGIQQTKTLAGPSLVKVKARIKEHPTLEFWSTFIKELIIPSDFLCGRKTDFAANLDWICGPKNFSKILAGNYANTKKNEQPLKSTAPKTKIVLCRTCKRSGTQMPVDADDESFICVSCQGNDQPTPTVAPAQQLVENVARTMGMPS